MRNERRKGAAMMEATLLLPLFLIFWFGIVDWGITFWVHQTIVHNANTAARWGVVHGWDAATIQNLVAYGKTTGSGKGMFGIDPKTNVTVDVCWLDATRTRQCWSNTGVTGPEYEPTRRIEITVSGYTWTHFTPFFAGTYTGRNVVVGLPTEDLSDAP